MIYSKVTQPYVKWVKFYGEYCRSLDAKYGYSAYKRKFPIQARRYRLSTRIQSSYARSKYFLILTKSPNLQGLDSFSSYIRDQTETWDFKIEIQDFYIFKF